MNSILKNENEMQDEGIKSIGGNFTKIDYYFSIKIAYLSFLFFDRCLFKLVDDKIAKQWKEILRVSLIQEKKMIQEKMPRRIGFSC